MLFFTPLFQKVNETFLNIYYTCHERFIHTIVCLQEVTINLRDRKLFPQGPKPELGELLDNPTELKDNLR